jgi:hypothetical protein
MVCPDRRGDIDRILREVVLLGIAIDLAQLHLENRRCEGCGPIHLGPLSPHDFSGCETQDLILVLGYWYGAAMVFGSRINALR